MGVINSDRQREILTKELEFQYMSVQINVYYCLLDIDLALLVVAFMCNDSYVLDALHKIIYVIEVIFVVVLRFYLCNVFIAIVIVNHINFRFLHCA